MERMEIQSKKTKPRPNFSKDKTKVLLDWLENHAEHPWPTKIEKKELCKESGLTYGQLRIWFTNNRKRKLSLLKNKKPSSIANEMNNTIKSKQIILHKYDCEIVDDQNARENSIQTEIKTNFEQKRVDLNLTERKLSACMLEMMNYCHCDLFTLCYKLNLMNNSFY